MKSDKPLDYPTKVRQRITEGKKEKKRRVKTRGRIERKGSGRRPSRIICESIGMRYIA